MKRLLLLSLLTAAVVTPAFLWWRDRDNDLNLLLITVDTLRADHLGFHGYPRKTSPFLDEFARSSLAFMDASVQVPKTLPSLVSMMTATYPNGNGVVHNSLRVEGLYTLAQVLDSEGFLTTGVVANPTAGHDTGTDKGFKEFEVPTGIVRAEHITDAALARFKQGFDRRFFMWLHYVDPHGPYDPPAPYTTMFYDDEYYDATRKVKLEYDPLEGFNENYVLGAAPRYQVNQSDVRKTQLDSYVARYDGEIRYLDDHLRRLIAGMDEMGLLERTIVVLTADHGEALGEHDYYFEHGWFVYQNQMHVPLIIQHPRMKPREISEPVELIELAPAVLQLLGVERPPAFQGRSLLRVLTGEGRDRVTVYGQNSAEYPDRFRMLRSGSWKYVSDAHGDERLFDLANDGQELSDVKAANPEMANMLRRRLRDGPWRARPNDPQAKPAPEPDEKVQEVLRTLGYLN